MADKCNSLFCSVQCLFFADIRTFFGVQDTAHILYFINRLTFWANDHVAAAVYNAGYISALVHNLSPVFKNGTVINKKSSRCIGSFCIHEAGRRVYAMRPVFIYWDIWIISLQFQDDKATVWRSARSEGPKGCGILWTWPTSLLRVLAGVSRAGSDWRIQKLDPSLAPLGLRSGWQDMIILTSNKVNWKNPES